MNPEIAARVRANCDSCAQVRSKLIHRKAFRLWSKTDEGKAAIKEVERQARESSLHLALYGVGLPVHIPEIPKEYFK